MTALVSGSDLYGIEVKVAAVPKARWVAVCRDCPGAIDSLVELLQGRFVKGVMARICHETTGLFPSPKEITFACSCPDWASMCKHVVAVLYGIGARLDEKPDLFVCAAEGGPAGSHRKSGHGPVASRKETEGGEGPRRRRLTTGNISGVSTEGMPVMRGLPPRQRRLRQRDWDRMSLDRGAATLRHVTRASSVRMAIRRQGMSNAEESRTTGSSERPGVAAMVDDQHARQLSRMKLVGATGFEPATFRSRTGRSTRLSHAPTNCAATASVFRALGSSFPNRVLL